MACALADETSETHCSEISGTIAVFKVIFTSKRMMCYLVSLSYVLL
jgi:hypothetical protein